MMQILSIEWPGMDAESFLAERPPADDTPLPAIEWFSAIAKIACGIVLLFGVAQLVPQEHLYFAGWVGGTGIVLILHFGVFHLLSSVWRRAGISTRQLMDRTAIRDVRPRVRRSSAARTSPIAIPSSLHARHHRAVDARDRSVVMDRSLARWVYFAGVAQLGILIASALVPLRLHWREELSGLSRLHRQMYWTYGGDVVLSIVAFALLSIVNADELAGGSGLARGFCAYVAVFWGIRGGLQFIFDVSSHLTAWWLRAGYAALSVLFAALTVVYASAALWWPAGVGI